MSVNAIGCRVFEALAVFGGVLSVHTRHCACALARKTFRGRRCWTLHNIGRVMANGLGVATPSAAVANPHLKRRKHRPGETLCRFRCELRRRRSSDSTSFDIVRPCRAAFSNVVCGHFHTPFWAVRFPPRAQALDAQRVDIYIVDTSEESGS